MLHFGSEDFYDIFKSLPEEKKSKQFTLMHNQDTIVAVPVANHLTLGTKCPAYGKECSNCGFKNHFKGTRKCPAMGKKCQSCGKPNQFAHICKSKVPL